MVKLEELTCLGCVGGVVVEADPWKCVFSLQRSCGEHAVCRHGMMLWAGVAAVSKDRERSEKLKK